MSAPFSSRLKQAPIWVGAATLIAALLLAAMAWSQSLSESGNTKTSPVAASAGPLDGRQFDASIVRDDANEEEKTRPLGDKLTFNDGNFSSAICERYNFKKAPYWVRVDDDQIHFLAELTSPTDGTMRWTGTVRGDLLEGTMWWTKKRWYWTIDVKHRIRGKFATELRAASPRSN